MTQKTLAPHNRIDGTLAALKIVRDILTPHGIDINRVLDTSYLNGGYIESLTLELYVSFAKPASDAGDAPPKYKRND